MKSPSRARIPTPADLTRQRTAQRDRALGRLSRLTTATAVAGTLATVGFGGLAAVTYSGAATTTDASDLTDTSARDPAQLTQGTQGTQGTQATAAPRVGSQSSSTSQQAAAPTARPVTRVVPPRTSTGRSHTSTGGSG